MAGEYSSPCVFTVLLPAFCVNDLLVIIGDCVKYDSKEKLHQHLTQEFTEKAKLSIDIVSIAAYNAAVDMMSTMFARKRERSSYV